MIVRSTFVIILNFILFYNGRTFILTDDNEGKYASLSPKDEEFPEEYLSRTQSTDTILRWSNGAYTWLMSQPCDRQNFTSEKTCALLKDIPKSDFRIYSFNPNNGGRYRIRFPDSANNRTVRYYDGVLVLDPFPNARFGHPLIIFYVTINVTTEAECALQDEGIRNVNDCLRVLYKNYCHHNNNISNGANKTVIVNGHGTRSLWWSSGCNDEHTFLPIVYSEYDAPLQINNRLRCYPNLDGFKRSCPLLRSQSQTSYSYCNPLLTNINCFYATDYYRDQCSQTHICDNAVLLSGGWNRQLGDLSSYSNLLNIKATLMAHGFLEDNIKTFFANGLNENDEGGNEQARSRAYLATAKVAIRNYVKSLCDEEHCSDSLFIYLNSPTKTDGSILLWDSNGNGLLDDTELYTTREFLRDISHCQANRVIVMADQSYAGALVNAAEARFSSLQNVVIFTAAEQFDWNSGHRDHLTHQFLRAKYTDTCLSDFKQFIRRSNNPSIFVGSRMDLLNSTLVGGPCTEEPSYLTDANSFIYRGCQSISVI